MKIVPCKGCQKPIAFVTGPSGLTPLDVKARVYRVIVIDGIERAEVANDSGFYVSHFHTCPKANEFSRSRKKGA